MSSLKKNERELRKEWREIVLKHGGYPRPWRIVLEELYPANWGETAVRRSLRNSGSCVTAKIISLSRKRTKKWSSRKTRIRGHGPNPRAKSPES